MAKIYIATKDQLNDVDAELKALITAEGSARQAQDTALSGRIDAVETVANTVPTNIDDLVTKLDGIESGAQVNKVEKIKVGSTEVEGDTNKVADITDAAKTLFAAEASDLAIKMIAVDTKDELPTTGETQAIYLVPNAGSGNDTHDEYIWTGTEYERIGTTDVDLTPYATKEYLANTYATKEELNNANTNLSDQVAEIEAKAVGLDDGVINVVLGKDDDGLYLSYEEEAYN